MPSDHNLDTFLSCMQRSVIKRTLRGCGRALKFELLAPAEVSSFDAMGSVGGKVWPSAERLITTVEDNKLYLAGKTVLELGSGCGYTGIACAALGARRVTLTDQLIKQNRMEYDMEGCLVENTQVAPNPILLDLCRRNIDINSDLLRNCEMSVAELEWGQQYERMLDNLVDQKGSFDMIIGSDLTYYPEATEALFWTVSKLLLTDSNKEVAAEKRFITAHQKRRDSSTRYTLECAMKAGLEHKSIDEDDNIVVWEFFDLQPKPKIGIRF